MSGTRRKKARIKTGPKDEHVLVDPTTWIPPKRLKSKRRSRQG